MRRNGLDARTIPALKTAVEAADKFECEIIEAFIMGDTHVGMVFKAAGSDVTLMVELHAKNYREGGKIVAKKLGNPEVS